jgi:branched-subunit amino acid aminotransferase/4-amino-4-deoxychorismate lyase
LERLEQSCALLRIVLPYTRCELISAVQYIMRRNDFRESLVKIYVTGGRSHSLLPEAPPSVIVACFPLPVFPTRFYRKGISLQTTPLARTLPAAKSTDYLAAVVASVTAHTMGYDEILFTDPATGCLLEGSTFNVFAVVGTTLITPIHGVLAGVTAQDIIALAEEEVGLRVERRGISPKDLDQATELFISSSNREIIPVRQLDDRTFSNCPGRMTRKLASEYLLRAMRQSHWIKP